MIFSNQKIKYVHRVVFFEGCDLYSSGRGGATLVVCLG